MSSLKSVFHFNVSMVLFDFSFVNCKVVGIIIDCLCNCLYQISPLGGSLCHCFLVKLIIENILYVKSNMLNKFISLIMFY